MIKTSKSIAVLATVAGLVLAAPVSGAMARTNSIAIAAAAAAGKSVTAGGARFNATTAAKATAFVAANPASPVRVISRTEGGNTIYYGSHGNIVSANNKPIVEVRGYRPPVLDSSGHLIARTNDIAQGKAPKHVVCEGNFCRIVATNG